MKPGLWKELLNQTIIIFKLKMTTLILEERLNYYIQHTDEALQIIKNANAYVTQFKNKKQEDLISLLVLEKYFYRTGQRTPHNSSLFN